MLYISFLFHLLSQSLVVHQLSHPSLLCALPISHGVALSPFPFRLLSLVVEPQSFPSLKETMNSKPKKKKVTYVRWDAHAIAIAATTKVCREEEVEDPMTDLTRKSAAWGWPNGATKAGVGSATRRCEWPNPNCDMKLTINGNSKRSPCSLCTLHSFLSLFRWKLEFKLILILSPSHSHVWRWWMFCLLCLCMPSYFWLFSFPL